MAERSDLYISSTTEISFEDVEKLRSISSMSDSSSSKFTPVVRVNASNDR